MQRRDFLKKGAGGTMAFALSGLIVAPTSAQAAGNTFDYSFTAEGATKSMVDGTSVFTWALNDNAGPSGPGSLGSGIIVTEGDTVNVTIANNLDRAINFVIPGVLGSTPSVAPGNSRTYTFMAPSAGTYMYTDGVNGFIGKAMGLAGPLVVMPADGSSALATGEPSFTKQYTMFMSDMDSRLNSAVESGGTYSIENYEPNYYFANGLIFPETKDYSDTLMTMSVGDDIAIRLINGGVIEYPMHFHGYHVNVFKNANQHVTDFVERDTVLVRPDTTAEVILPVIQSGIYPLHTHYVPGVTVNGIYTNPYGGGLILMVAS
jgi:FtsP/CotA-like multicopper oxidase with cupredoxin domain